MRMLSRRLSPALCLATVLLSSTLSAQHGGHDMSAMSNDTVRAMRHNMVQAIPLVTRADPSAGGIARSQFAVTQLVLMSRATFLRKHAQFDGTLNGEGLTMPNGELNTGAAGEGFVDRRHPHTYIHELMLTGLGAAGPLSYSSSAGRGFATFGTDDPMMRPIVKYPVNHHLAQILERAVLIGAARVGPAILEGSTFSGDEPSMPSSLPHMSRFGDSWATRLTWLPAVGSELQASYARVASPEEVSGHGLDQRKQSYSARTESADGYRYLLAEWARTVERDHDRDVDVFSFESALVEASMLRGPLAIALRFEQTDRPEEERLAEPFRTPRPASDLSNGGVTRWRVATLQFGTPALTRGMFYGFPFVEVERLSASPRDPRSLLTPQRLYGTSNFWMATVGVRLRVGNPHPRMGRYGVALPNLH